MRLFTRTDPKMTKKLILNDSIFITNRVSVFKNSLTKCSPLLTIVLKLVEWGMPVGDMYCHNACSLKRCNIFWPLFSVEINF